MISFLIPIYNYDARELVRDLHAQCVHQRIPFEIRCCDDGSNAAWRNIHDELSILQGVVLTKLGRNIGRAAIRNRLASEATYPQLVFMDCDSAIPDKDYVSRYCAYNGKSYCVYGGRSYLPTPPQEKSKYFRWYYGTKAEQKPAALRSVFPYRSFMTNNFMVQSRVFHSIRFDERIREYGHEDTLFGLELREKKVEIMHIDNPLIHLGLEETEDFISKTRSGLKNLAMIYRSEKGPLLAGEVALLRAYEKWRRSGLTNIVRRISADREKGIMKNLKSTHPKLWIFDLWKLGVFSAEMKKA